MKNRHSFEEFLGTDSFDLSRRGRNGCGMTAGGIIFTDPFTIALIQQGASQSGL
ncbi:hypothetical protein [Chryseobacterium arachidis]|uniref:hypothetical protein n=1 Tax=Chryseobacterium arachidis TaxID=1416778 RepID=UPI0015B4FE7F|nr:hypothetical protein [Chryseobacterium arachidis]